jgi:hypothetical protein
MYKFVTSLKIISLTYYITGIKYLNDSSLYFIKYQK